jgi:hypothetical protein
VQGCSGNGHYVLHGHPIASQILGGGGKGGACHCHTCFSGPQCEVVDPDCVLNVFQSVLSLSLSLSDYFTIILLHLACPTSLWIRACIRCL